MLKKVKKVLTPIEKFFRMEASAGIILLITALCALIFANSSYSEIYHQLLDLPLGIGLGDFSFSLSLHEWVNDALMVIFFFFVGLEIKRELTIGELATPKKAALPIFAALGGMLVPALIYFAFNFQIKGAQVGWAIPMATDIAFALGVLSLVSKKIPFSLKVFLLALAIVDDLGAVLVIAFFYSKEISGQFLAFGGLSLLVMFCAQKAGIKGRLFYILCGLCLWVCVLNSGVHATVAGVILGLMSPFKNKDASNNLIEELHPYVTWFIMPVFAFFNAGVVFDSGFSFPSFIANSVSLGILFGLILGKPIGILLFSHLSVCLNLAAWPTGFNHRKLIGVGFLAGIGFTMALFISHLSFESEPWAMYSKLSILLASLIAMLVGLAFLLFSGNFEE